MREKTGFPRRTFLGLLAGTALGAKAPENASNADAVCGTWVLQQAAGKAELDRLLSALLAPALATPRIRGFSLRVPWKAIAGDLSLLEAGLAIARKRNLDYSVRFMAGRHTPARLFDKGCPFYLRRATDEKIPMPFFRDGSPNLPFENEYETIVSRLATWCRANGVRLLHLAWYGQSWAELNHGKEVRATPGYSYDHWLHAHVRLLDIGLRHAGKDLSIELPFSGYGPLTEAACALADHVVEKIGPSNPLFFCQANGWRPGSDWGAPTRTTEVAFDKVWEKPVCRGLQAIQPSDFVWPLMFQNLYENMATYCEIYAASFTKRRRSLLASEIVKFADHCEKRTPIPPAS